MQHSSESYTTVTINQAVVRATLADTDAKHEQGLSGHPSLAPDEGMLFIFDHADLYGFWMKDMNFPLDIIWIANNQVVGFSENLAPDPSPERKIYYPPEPVDRVLEVRSGFVKEQNINVGDKVQIEGGL